MRIYIIHSPKNSEHYFERIRSAETTLIRAGHHIVNPLPDDVEVNNPEYDNVDAFREHAHKISMCDAVFAMDGYAKEDIGNQAMAEAMLLRKTITFEQTKEETVWK